MLLELGQHIRASDGKDIGAITHLIVNPGNNQVKTLVVAKGSFLPDDIEIPLEAIQKRDSEGVSVLYTGEQAKHMPRFDASRYLQIPPGLIGGIGADRYLGPPSALDYSMPVSRGESEEASSPPPPLEVQAYQREQDENNAILSAGDGVFSKDGEQVGEVQSIAFDRATGRPTSLTIRQERLFPDGWELSGDEIASIDDGVVSLSLDKADLLRKRDDEQYATEWSQNDPSPDRQK